VSRKYLVLPLLLLLTVAYLAPSVHAAIIVNHRDIDGTNGNMLVIVYVYKDEDSDPNEDFYAFQIRVHAKNIPGHMLTDLSIYSPEGICDRWEPTAGKKGGSFSFSYGKTISFSVTIPEAYIDVYGVNTHEISWRVSPCDDSWDIDFGAGFYVPQDSPFHWTINVYVYCYTIIAWFMVGLWEDTAYWSTIPSGGGGCPTLFVWNGTAYVEEGVLNIHAESDITVQHRIENTLALENCVYKLQLRELDNYTSHVDQVKLYAVSDTGKVYPCPLIYADHSELGCVTLKLLFDDEKRVDLTPTQIIDLKFLPSTPYSQTAYFIFEINGYNMKWTGE